MGAQGTDVKSTGDKKDNNTCGKVHDGPCNKKFTIATAEVKKPMGKQANGGSQNKTRSKEFFKCPICNDPQHQKILPSGDKGNDRSITSCPKWNKSSSAEKVKILEEVQAIPVDICKICSNLGHNSASCYNKDRYICENSHCGKEHIKDICDFQPFIVSCLQQAVLPPVVPCIRRVIPVVPCIRRVVLQF